jgi:hypothetical protein
MMSVEKEMSEVTTSVKDREKKIRELGKAVAAKGDTNKFYGGLARNKNCRMLRFLFEHVQIKDQIQLSWSAPEWPFITHGRERNVLGYLSSLSSLLWAHQKTSKSWPVKSA